MGWLALFLFFLQSTRAEDVAAAASKDDELLVLALPSNSKGATFSIDEVLKREEHGIRWCYKAEAALLEPGVEALTVVLIAVDEEGAMSVMTHDDMYSTVGSDRSNACLARYLGKYKATREERNRMMVKKTIVIPREVTR